MEEKKVEQRIIFYYDIENEKDFTKIYTCSSYLFKSCNKYKSFIKDLHDISVRLYTTCSIEKKYTEFKMGTLIFENKEYKIKNFDLYYFLPVNEKIETRIGICKIDKELFLKLKQ